MMNGFIKTDGRRIVVACITVYLLFVGMLTGPLHGVRVTVMQALGVFAMESVFSDTLFAAHWCDGCGRGLILPLALLSPNVVIAVERGNFDSLIFWLLVALGLLMARPAIAGVFVLGATALKIYSATALAALLIRRQPAIRKFACCAVSALVLGICLMIVNGHAAGDLGEAFCCFGSKVVMIIMSPHLGMVLSYPGIASQTVVLLLMILGFYRVSFPILQSAVASPVAAGAFMPVVFRFRGWIGNRA